MPKNKMTLAEFAKLTKQKVQSKYRNVKTVIDGITFSSKREASRYSELKILEKAGHIKNLKLQKRYCLLKPFEDKFGTRHRGAFYICDFAYSRVSDGRLEAVAEDVKGYDKNKQKFITTPLFQLKMKLFIRKYPYIKFEIV